MCRQLVLLIFVALPLAGCVQYHSKPVSLDKMGAGLEARTLSDERLRRFMETNRPGSTANWPLSKWGVEELTLAALYYHPSIKLARADWVSARAATATARERPNPTLTAGPGYNFSATDATPWLPFASLDWPIETAGKRGRRIEQARYNSDAALLNLVKAAWQARSRVRAALLDGASATLRERALNRQVELQQQTLEFLEKRRAAGAMSAAELTPARLALQKLRLDRTDARRLNAEARAQLAEAVGVPVAAFDAVELEFDVAKTWPGGPELLAEEARRRALSSRADVLEALTEYQASEAALHLEIAKQYPDVHFVPGYQLDDGQHKATFGASVELPILNQNQGPIAEATAKRESAAARVEAAQAGVIADVDRAAAVFRVAEASMTEAQQFVAVQRKQAESVEHLYKAGGADRVDILAAQLDLAASEAALLDGQTRTQQAIGALEDAVQQPLDGFEPKLSVLAGTENAAAARQVKGKKP
jgi:outer membrane protein TolC